MFNAKIAHKRPPCYDVAPVRKRDGAKQHDTLPSDAGYVPDRALRNAAVGRRVDAATLFFLNALFAHGC